MCVRALDYCPPLDLTFGEYLRAIITADVDMVPDDDRNYRVAFVEAFRRRGLYPRDVRTLSTENLVWRGPHNDDRRHSAKLLPIIRELRDDAHRQLYARDRREIFRRERAVRAQLHRRLADHFASGEEGRRDAFFLGLDLDASDSFEVHAVHFATRVGPDGDVRFQLLIQITQHLDVPGNGYGTMPFEGGSTVVADLEQARILYCIRKPLGSLTRRERQRQFLRELAEDSLRSTYFGPPDVTNVREPFALLHRGL
jgi:hypothetical protein